MCWAWLLPGSVFVNISKSKEQIPCTECKTRVPTRAGYFGHLSGILMGQNTFIHVAAPLQSTDLFHTPIEFFPAEINSWPLNSKWCFSTWNVLQENTSFPSLPPSAGSGMAEGHTSSCPRWSLRILRGPEWAIFSCFPWISTFHHPYFPKAPLCPLSIWFRL